MWKDGTLQTSELRIQITNEHIYAKGIWVIHVREFNWNTKPMNIPNDSTIEQAQKRAVEMCKNHLNKAMSSLGVLPLQVKELFAELTDDQRMEVMGDYCKHCGCDDNGCQCWNDD